MQYRALVGPANVLDHFDLGDPEIYGSLAQIINAYNKHRDHWLELAEPQGASAQAIFFGGNQRWLPVPHKRQLLEAHSAGEINRKGGKPEH
jgi:hypothetical protein